jgi:hypothetical protein
MSLRNECQIQRMLLRVISQENSLYNITSFTKLDLMCASILYDTRYNLIQICNHAFRMDPHSIFLVIQNYKFRISET